MSGHDSSPFPIPLKPLNILDKDFNLQLGAGFRRHLSSVEEDWCAQAILEWHVSMFRPSRMIQIEEEKVISEIFC